MYMEWLRYGSLDSDEIMYKCSACGHEIKVRWDKNEGLPMVCPFCGKLSESIGLKVGDLIDIKSACDELGVSYFGALFVGFGDDVKFASYDSELSEYPVVLRHYCNSKYEVVRVGEQHKTEI